jgi:hypothetical protein
MEIKNYKPINSGCLKSTFTILIPEWANQEVDCTYFEKSDGSYWVNFGPREYTTKEGKKKSWNQVRWPQPVTERLTKAIRDIVTSMEYKELEIKNEPIMPDEQLPF